MSSLCLEDTRHFLLLPKVSSFQGSSESQNIVEFKKRPDMAIRYRFHRKTCTIICTCGTAMLSFVYIRPQ